MTKWTLRLKEGHFTHGFDYVYNKKHLSPYIEQYYDSLQQLVIKHNALLNYAEIIKIEDDNIESFKEDIISERIYVIKKPLI